MHPGFSLCGKGFCKMVPALVFISGGTRRGDACLHVLGEFPGQSGFLEKTEMRKKG